MTAVAAPPLVTVATAPRVKVKPGMYALTVEQYDRMVELGILTEADRVELIDGYLVDKMPANPEHDFAIRALDSRFQRLLGTGWTLSNQMGVRLARSRPEPDLSVARGGERVYAKRHPSPTDLALVVEVAHSSLDFDQEEKAVVYARDRIPVYWIVNLPERRVEVYTDPTGPGDEPRYATTRVFPAGTAVPVELDGQTVGTIPVDEILP